MTQSLLDVLASHPWKTGELLQWKQIRELAEKAGPPIDRCERCNLLLDVANGREPTHAEWTQLVGVQVAESTGLPLQLSNDQRVWLLSNLVNFVEGDASHRAKMAADSQRDASGKVAIFPIKEKRKRGMREHVITVGINAAMVYALSILFDPDQKFASKLCRCGFSQCRRFFWEYGTRRPIREWCERKVDGETHQTIGTRERAKLRMATRRRKGK